MKREILCPKCAKESISAMIRPTLYIDGTFYEPYPGEHLKQVRGKAIRAMFCDGCVTSININDEVIALSLWSGHGGIPYYEWEGDYIKIDGST